MGLWQIAQAATVLNTPIQSVYPEGADSLMRLDFNRIFFLIDYNESTDTDPIIVMWTSAKKECPPFHFAPLLAKKIQVCKNSDLLITLFILLLHISYFLH